MTYHLCFSDAANGVGAGLGDHVNVRRPFPSSKSGQSDPMTASYHGHLGDTGPHQQQPGTCLMSQSMISDPAQPAHDNRQSIEHSLALIRHHVKVITCSNLAQQILSTNWQQNGYLDYKGKYLAKIRNKNTFVLIFHIKIFQGLNDVQMYGGVPPPPPSDQSAITPPVCPPPPGFSDSDSMSEDNDSLTSDPGSFNRFGFSRVSRQHSLAAHDKWRQDRMMPQVRSYHPQFKQDRHAIKTS